MGRLEYCIKGFLDFYLTNSILSLGLQHLVFIFECVLMFYRDCSSYGLSPDYMPLVPGTPPLPLLGWWNYTANMGPQNPAREAHGKQSLKIMLIPRIETRAKIVSHFAKRRG